MKALLGKKIGMTQVFNKETGEVTPVTILQLGPCPVVQVKSKDKHGYEALQIGYGDIRTSRVTLPIRGHYQKANTAPRRCLKEVRVDNASEFDVGQELTVSVFKDAKKVDVTGVSKGKGFQGGIKRHGFGTGPKTHGSRNYRRPGSIGQCATPARTLKGVRMSGRTGNEKITTRNLAVAQIDEENNLLVVGGAVPGAKNGYVLVRAVD